MTSTPPPPRAALGVLLAGAFMVVLDFFIVNVALPSMGTGLGASPSALEWVVAGYGLTFAAFVITAGRLGDDRGRRLVFTAGLSVFTLASLACGLAPDAGTLIAARAAQGVGGALVMPQVLAIVGVAFGARGLARFGVVAGLAAVGGQVIGGALVETVGWRACFLINVPVGLAALALAPRVVPELRAAGRSRLDVAGAALLAAALTAACWGSSRAARTAGRCGRGCRSAPRRCSSRSSCAACTAARRRCWTSACSARAGSRPGSPPSSACPARRPRSSSISPSLQGERGLTPLEAGLVFTILAAAYVVVSGPAAQRHGRGVVVAGGVCLTLGLLALLLALDGPLGALVPGLVLAGAGVGLCYTPLTVIVLATVAPGRAGGASGAMATTQQVGYALGVAVTGIVYFGEGFEASLVELALVAAATVVAALALPAAATERTRVPEPVVVGLG